MIRLGHIYQAVLQMHNLDPHPFDTSCAWQYRPVPLMKQIATQFCVP
jgi:hypothetical protein